MTNASMTTARVMGMSQRSLPQQSSLFFLKSLFSFLKLMPFSYYPSEKLIALGPVVPTAKAEKIESITSVSIMVLSIGNPTTEEKPLSLGFLRKKCC